MTLPNATQRLLLAAAMTLLVAPLFVQAQAPAPAAERMSTTNGPRPIALDDYPAFRRIGGMSLSANGVWMAYTVTPNEGDGKLFIRNIDGGTVHEITRGANASFSDDGRWIGYFISPPSEGRGRGGRGRGGRGATTAQGEDGDRPSRTFHLMDLNAGTSTTFPAVASFSFSPDGNWLLLRPQTATSAQGEGGGGRGGRGGRGGAVNDASSPGSDLLMRELATGRQRYLGNVGEYAFDDSGALLAYTVRGQERLGNGIYVLTMASGEQTMLDVAAADYDQLAWSEEGVNLAVLRGDKARDRFQKDNVLLAWTGVGTPSARQVTIDPKTADGFPAGMVVSEFASLRWSDDGARLLLGLKEQEPARPEPDDPQANVDVWHWKDTEPQSAQIVRLEQDRRSTFAAIADLASGTIRQVADAEMRSIAPTDDLTWAIGRLDAPYRGEISWGGSRADIYRVNLTTGERTLIEPSLSRTMGTSPDGKWFVYLKDGKVYSYEMISGRKTQIDGGRSFVNAEDDHDYERPVYGIGGFTADGASVLMYDRYDVWSLPLAGGRPVNLTKGEGAKNEVRYRITRFGSGGGRGGRGGGRGGGGGGEPIDLSQPVTLSAYGEYTKQSGYAELRPGGAPEPLIWADKSIGSPIAAEDADRMIFTQSTFTEYPNYWVADKRFSSPRQITDAHPDLFTTFAWGTKTLIDYENRHGQRLQGTLTLPANYEPGKRYPMIVYFYEIMSNQHHSFPIPQYDDRPHVATYASNGYLVLQPDVVYEIGKPGTSALDCVTSAVKRVIDLGYADPDRVGLQGHSWGGYQSSFIVTQTDLFAAVVTGAPPTDLTSFYGTLYRSSGNIQQGITEVGQVRMGRDVTPWSAHELYESQSPVHNAPNITTPFLILHGTADGAVDWMQGLEFYAAARRLGKEVILLSYPDEPHHLGRRENQKDFQVRMRQFFDHYLKGEPAPAWMTEGVPQIRKGLEGGR
jgi:dipeptidyl aminopeptidase/acylaminoacyl peptidase